MSKGEDSTIGEARCAPYPFDVMAIFALYQAVPTGVSEE